MADPMCLNARMMAVMLLLGTILNFAQSSAVALAQGKNVKHELAELKEAIDRIENKVDVDLKDIIHQVENKVDDIHQYVFGDVQYEALITGVKYNVQDGGLTASSSHAPNHGPQCSRLGIPKPSKCVSYAWCASTSDSNKWLQVDLGRTFDIHAVATQARGDCCQQWAKTYVIASLHGTHFVYYSEPNGTTKKFSGNHDSNSIIRHPFVPPIRAQIVRLYLVSWNAYGCLRWELYGRPAF